MIFSKRNFAAACLLLGSSGLLVSCGGTIPNEVPTESEELTADTADCLIGAGESEIRKSASSEKRPSGVKTEDVDTADCIKVD